jgi:predicted chitinase
MSDVSSQEFSLPQRPESAKKIARKRAEGRIRMNRTIRPELKLLPVAAAVAIAGHAAINHDQHVDNADMTSVIVEPVSASTDHDIKIGAHPQKYEKNEILITPVWEAKISDVDIDRAMQAVPEGLKGNAKEAIPIIAEALRNEKIDSKAMFAYALATAEHESFFEAIHEAGAEEQAEKYSYDGGSEYHGRGYIMLTGKQNYEVIGNYLGYDLVGDPDLLLNPKIAAKAMAAYFNLFGTKKYINERDFIHARKTVNGSEFDMNDEPFKSTPYKIAKRANDYLESIKK